jgi:general secretion pathway protein G
MRLRTLETTHQGAAAARRRRSGFSLAELMVVIVILGLLAAVVVRNVWPMLSSAFQSRVKTDIMAIDGALNEYAVNNGMQYPDSLDVLIQPDDNGHRLLDRKTLPVDPWKNEYLYEPPGPGEPNPRVYTLGKDGAVGGEGDNRDIDNFMIKDNEI